MEPIDNGHVDTDVAVVGFGPVGGILAGLLGRRGLRVSVFELEADVFALPRAAHIDHQGLRALQELGILDDLLPSMRVNPGMYFVNAGGRLLLRIPSDRPSRSGLPTSVYFHQPGFDRAIRALDVSLPTVEAHLRTMVTGIDTGPDAVELTVRRAGGSEGGERTVSARYVVGCDGANSTVRQALGIELEDLGFTEAWIVVDVALQRPVADLPDRAVNICDPARPHLIVPMPAPRYRFELMLLPGEDPAIMQQPASVHHLISPWIPDGAARLERQAVYTFRGVVARQWRSGRVMLAGDAAHLMPPFLGQGMCSGIRDATNLAWKLGAVARGTAPPALLDSYEIERRPHVRAVIKAAIAFGRVICTTDPAEAATRDEQLLGEERVPEGLSGFRLPDLPPGPLVVQGGGELFVQPVSPGPSGRLDDTVGQRFLVAATTERALGSTGRWWADQVGALVTTTDRLHDAEGIVRRWMDDRGVSVVVVRPDRYVLGAGLDLDAITAGVRDVLVAKRAPAGR